MGRDDTDDEVLTLVALEEAVKAKALCLHRIALVAVVLYSTLCGMFVQTLCCKLQHQA